MTNAMQIIRTRVLQNIPLDILKIAVKKYNKENQRSLTTMGFITDVIIHEFVLPEINLAGGKVKTFPLRAEWVEQTNADHGGYAGDDGQYSLFRIPPEVRDNKPISYIMSVQYPYNTYLGGGVNSSDIGLGGYCLADQVDEVLNSFTLARPRNHPVAELLSGDLVKITPSQYALQNWLMTVRIDFDESFMNITPNSVPTLANVVMLATKQWIHTNLIIDLDRAYMETGADIGALKSIIDGYADSGQMFAEEIIKYRGSTLLDMNARRQLIQYII